MLEGREGGTGVGPVGSFGESLASGVRSGRGQRDAMALLRLMVHGGYCPAGEERGLRALRGLPEVWPVLGTEAPPFLLAEAGQEGGSHPGGRAEGEEGPVTVGAAWGASWRR